MTFIDTGSTARQADVGITMEAREHPDVSFKFAVKVEDRTFNVEIGDLDARPIVAMVEGDRFV